MDLVMPHLDGVKAIEEIRAALPGTHVLILTTYADDEYILAGIQAGARGYLLKDALPDELVQAIQQVYRGESSLHPSIARRLLQQVSHPSARGPDTAALTERELCGLQLVARGRSNKEIADRLSISEATARTHVSNILAKLNLGSRTQAALYALREGLASLHGVES